MMFLGNQVLNACQYLDVTHSGARWHCVCEEKISWQNAQSHITRSVMSGNLFVLESMSMLSFKLYLNWS